MKRKALAIFMVLAIVIGSLSGCSKPSDANASEAAISPAESEEKVIIKLGHVEPEDRSTHKATLEFKKYVEEQSGGKISVEIYPNGQLGGDRQMLESVALGTIQMTIPSTSVLTTYDPKFGILDMPFIFNDVDTCFKALDGDVGQTLDVILPTVGMKNFGYSYNGARSMSNNLRPINSPEDLVGIKMRVMESPVFIDLFKHLGANPTPMSFGEVFTALQQGTVDAQENSPSLVYSMKFNEVQKYYSLTDHVQGILANVINDKFFTSLPADQQKIVQEGAIKFLVQKQRQLEIDDTEMFLQKLVDSGMIINEITPENHQKFVDALKPMYEKYSKEIGQEKFDMIEKQNQ